MKRIQYQLLALALLFSNVLAAQQTYISPIQENQGTRTYDTWSGNSKAYQGQLLEDNNLLMAGYGYSSGCNCYNITMVKVDTVCGALDPEFANGGILSHRFEGRSTLNDFYVTDEGKIVGCGTTAPSNGWSGHKNAVYRFLPDGTPDSTFFGTGFRKQPFTTISSGNFNSVFPAHGGKIIAVGPSQSNINGGVNGFGVMRFNEDGSLDGTFSGDGMNMVQVSSWSNVFVTGQGTAVMLSDSSIAYFPIVNINSQDRLGMLKFDAQGNLDTSVGTNGLLILDHPIIDNYWEAMDAVVTPDDKIYVGSSHLSTYEYYLTRILPNGQLDSLYGTDGSSIVPIGTTLAPASNIQLLEDGSTLQYGSQNWNDGHARIVKRDANGNLDTSFGTNGIASPNTPTWTLFFGGIQVAPGRFIGWGAAEEVSFFKFVADPEAERFYEAGDDLSACMADTLTLDAGPGYLDYSWSTGVDSQFTQVSMSGEYVIHVQDTRECYDNDTVNVTFNTPPPTPIIDVNGFILSTTAVGDLQWYLNGEAIDGATADTYEAEVSGDYSVVVTDAVNGCGAASATVTLTGVGLFESSMGHLSVYPNPSAGHFFIQDLPSDAAIIVYDARGKVITHHLSAQGEVSLGNVDAGIYHLILSSPEGRFQARLIIQ